MERKGEHRSRTPLFGVQQARDHVKRLEETFLSGPDAENDVGHHYRQPPPNYNISVTTDASLDTTHVVCSCRHYRKEMVATLRSNKGDMSVLTAFSIAGLDDVVALLRQNKLRLHTGYARPPQDRCRCFSDIVSYLLDNEASASIVHKHGKTALTTYSEEQQEDNPQLLHQTSASAVDHDSPITLTIDAEKEPEEDSPQLLQHHCDEFKMLDTLPEVQVRPDDKSTLVQPFRAQESSSHSRHLESERKPTFCKQWQFGDTFSRNGGKLQGDQSDVVLYIPEDAIRPADTVTIRGAISVVQRQTSDTPLGSIAERGMIVSPVAEYSTDQKYEFQKHVRISVRHFLPGSFCREAVRVYKFKAGEDKIMHAHLLTLQQSEDDSETSDLTGFFRFSGTDRVEVLMPHFCAIACTYCQKIPPNLMIQLYGKCVQRDTRDVELSLIMWDKRLACKDSSLVFVPHTGEQTLLHARSSIPDTENISVMGRLLLDEGEQSWVQRKFRGELLFPETQMVDLKEYRPCCPDTQPKVFNWHLHNAPGTTPAWFRCVIDTGYVREMGAARCPLEFLENPPKTRLPVTLETAGREAGESASNLTRTSRKSTLQKQCTRQDSLELKSPIPVTHDETATRSAFAYEQVQLQESGHRAADVGRNLPSVNSDEIKVIPVSADSDEMRVRFQEVVKGKNTEIYRMQQNPRGLFLIINNKSFRKARDKGFHHSDRRGTDRDASALTKLFTELGFLVEQRNDCTADSILKVIEQHVRLALSQHDCFACAILSHGRENAITGVDGSHLTTEDIKQIAASSTNTALIGKPKLFFIQACQGSGNDVGNTLENHTVAHSGLVSNGHQHKDQVHVSAFSERPAAAGDTISTYSKLRASYVATDGPTVPKSADFFMAVPAASGHLSMRDETLGSWFIQTLTKVFAEKACTEDLLSLMTEVNSRVGEFATPMEGFKQQPNTQFSLGKKLFFFPGLYSPRNANSLCGRPHNDC